MVGLIFGKHFTKIVYFSLYYNAYIPSGVCGTLVVLCCAVLFVVTLAVLKFILYVVCCATSHIPEWSYNLNSLGKEQLPVLHINPLPRHESLFLRFRFESRAAHNLLNPENETEILAMSKRWLIVIHWMSFDFSIIIKKHQLPFQNTNVKAGHFLIFSDSVTVFPHNIYRQWWYRIVL